VVELQHSLTLQGFSRAYCAVAANILACDQALWWGKDFACQIFFAIFPTKELVHRAKVSIPTPYMVIGNCEGGGGGVGEGGASKAKIFKGKYEAKLEFLDGGGDQMGRGIRYFLAPHISS